MPLSGAAPGAEEQPEEGAPEEDMPEEALLEAGPPELSSELTSGSREVRYGWGGIGAPNGLIGKVIQRTGHGVGFAGIRVYSRRCFQ